MRKASNWQALLAVARELIDQVNAEANVIDRWTLGGGTALMLQIGHRESYDIDIFLDDPQLLGFLDPAKRDFKLAVAPDSFGGDGTRFLKFSFEGIGEIDFIAAAPLTEFPSARRLIFGREADVETAAEIIAKKIHFRGRSIQPRDIFDIAAAAQSHGVSLRAALQGFEADAGACLEKMRAINPAFVETALSELVIRPEFAALARDALSVSIRFLETI